MPYSENRKFIKQVQLEFVKLFIEDYNSLQKYIYELQSSSRFMAIAYPEFINGGIVNFVNNKLDDESKKNSPFYEKSIDLARYLAVEYGDAFISKTTKALASPLVEPKNKRICENLGEHTTPTIQRTASSITDLNQIKKISCKTSPAPAAILFSENPVQTRAQSAREPKSTTNNYKRIHRGKKSNKKNRNT